MNDIEVGVIEYVTPYGVTMYLASSTATDRQTFPWYDGDFFAGVADGQISMGMIPKSTEKALVDRVATTFKVDAGRVRIKHIRITELD